MSRPPIFKVVRNKRVPNSYKPGPGDVVRYRFIVDVGLNPETQHRRQVTRTHNMLREAETDLASVLGEVVMDTYVSSNMITLAQVIDMYLEYAAIDTEEATKSNYRYALLPVRELQGEIRVQQYGEKDVDKLVLWMLTSSRRRGGALGTGLSLRSVRLTLGQLREALKLAERRKLVTRNVAEDTKIPRWARKQDQLRQTKKARWTKAEIKQFLTFIVGDRLEAPALLALMGVGPAELCGERWRPDVDLDAEQIQVADNTRTIVWGNDGGQVVEKDGKSPARKRWLPLPDRVTTALRALQQRQAVERQVAADGYEDTGYVLVDELGRPFKTDQWRRALYKLMRQAGVQKVTPYSARHACLTYLAVRGVPDVIVSAWAGHSDLNTAKRFYIHPALEDLQQGRDKLAELFA